MFSYHQNNFQLSQTNECVNNCYYGKDEIPNGWSCLQLQYFSKIFTGNSLNDSQKLKFSVKADNAFCYVSTKDIDLNGNVNYENGIYTPINEKLKIAKAKSILICLEGANAGNKIAIIDKDINFVNKLACVETFSVIEKFIYYFFCSSVFNEEFRSNLQGIIGGVPLSKFKELSILIPPLQEQQRIATKLDELFALIDKIEKEQEELEEYKKLAKEKVLELAVTGKLVKQDPNDEPASVLLNRIKKEKEALIKAGKIKKDKVDNEPLSDDDKNYYKNLPNGWTVCFLSEIIKEIRAGGDKPKKFSLNRTAEYSCPVIANGLENDGIVGYTNKAIVEEDCITISARGTIGVPTKRNYSFVPIVRLIVITFLNAEELIDYVKLFLTTKAIKSTGTSIQQLTVPQTKSMAINLPPLNEQRRIVKKIDSLEQVLK